MYIFCSNPDSKMSLFPKREDRRIFALLIRFWRPRAVMMIDWKGPWLVGLYREWPTTQLYRDYFITSWWLQVSTHLKNMSQNGNLPQTGVKIKHIWNHHLDKILWQDPYLPSSIMECHWWVFITAHLKNQPLAKEMDWTWKEIMASASMFLQTLGGMQKKPS